MTSSSLTSQSATSRTDGSLGTPILRQPCQARVASAQRSQCPANRKPATLRAVSLGHLPHMAGSLRWSSSSIHTSSIHTFCIHTSCIHTSFRACRRRHASYRLRASAVTS